VIYPFNLPNIKFQKSYLTFTSACHEKRCQFFFCLINQHTESGNIYCICMSNQSVWFHIWVILICYYSLRSSVTVSFSKLTAINTHCKLHYSNYKLFFAELGYARYAKVLQIHNSFCYELWINILGGLFI
jgi:hypothetical protein